MSIIKTSNPQMSNKRQIYVYMLNIAKLTRLTFLYQMYVGKVKSKFDTEMSLLNSNIK